MKNNVKKLVSPVFFLAILTLGLLTYKDYGVSFDEPAQRLIGVTNLNYIAHKFNLNSIIDNESLAQFPKRLDQITDRDYGVIFELPAAFLEHALDLKQERDIYHTRHLFTFLFFLAGVFAVYRMAQRRFNDWRIGLIAATFLILSPRIFADAFYNDKDLVFLAVFAIAMNTSISFLVKPNWKTAFIHGLACAVAIDARLMAVIIPALTVFVLALKVSKREEQLKNAVIQIMVFLVTSTVFTVILWPFLWDAPLDNFIQAFKNMAKFRWAPNFLFRGEMVNGADLPWYYLPIWIGITTPLVYLGLFIAGSFSILISLIKNHFRLWENDNDLQDLVFYAYFIGPTAAVILLHSVLYNGWRHLYFVYPAFILICVRGLILLWDIPKFTIFYRSFLVIAVLFGCLHTSFWMIKYHPLQNVFFNRFAGNWNERFEVDYWGLSNKPALDKILKASKEDRFTAWPGRGYQWPGGWQLPYVQNLKIFTPEDQKRIETSESYKDADFVIASKQGRREHNIDAFKSKHQYELIDEVIVDDTPILSIFKYNKDAQLPSMSPGDKVSFSQYSQGLEYLGSGWQEPEVWGSWSSTTRSQLTIPLSKNKPRFVEIRARAIINKIVPQQTVEIWINGKFSKSINITESFGNQIVIDIPKDAENLNLELRMPNAARPVDLGINKDERLLALGLESISFK